jgi:sulfate adenylyltransferase subunit 1
LRFLTAGSVDDGKSTLIGRLLYDSRAILADQLDVLHAKAAGEPIDLSLLTDGLEAEREQGITIDVAFRLLRHRARRKFIIADAPGHEQYTRNMVTAAAGSDAAVVLVDLTKIDWRAPVVELLPQTRRHALLAQLLRVPSIVFAINKIDAVDEPAPRTTR